MNDEITVEEAASFSDPDASYKAALNNPTVFEALCSNPETIRSLIDVFTMKVEHLETQLTTRARRMELEVEDNPSREAHIRANHAEWEAKVKALLRSTVFHLRQALRRAHLLWDDPVETLRQVRALIASELSDGDCLDAIDELVDKALTLIESERQRAKRSEFVWPPK